MKKKMLGIIVMMCLLLVFPMPVNATMDNYITDNADLLSDQEEQDLNKLLKMLSFEQGFDIVAITEKEMGGKSSMEYADDFYDQEGYGQGEERDGCVLLINMENREWWISTSGYGTTALTDAGIGYVGDKVANYLSEGNYYGGFESYANTVNELVTRAKEGNVFDVESTTYTEEKKSILPSVLAGLVAGLVIAFLVTGVLMGQLKSVSAKSSAGDYFVTDSLTLTGSFDKLAGLHVTKRRKEKEKSGGSSTHRSSSGRTHGGGGGKF